MSNRVMSVYAHVIPNDNRHYGMTKPWLVVLSNGIALFSAKTQEAAEERIEKDLQCAKLSKVIPNQVVRCTEQICYC